MPCLPFVSLWLWLFLIVPPDRVAWTDAALITLGVVASYAVLAWKKEIPW